MTTADRLLRFPGLRWANVLALTLAFAAFGCDDDDDGGNGGNGDAGTDARGDGGTNDQGTSDTPTQDVPTIDQPTNDTTADTTTDTPTATCGEVTFFGECEGTVLRYCDCDPSGPDGVNCTNGTLEEFDCAETEAGTGVCELLTDEDGFFCMLSAGDACVGLTQDEQVGVDFCAGTDGGCVVIDFAAFAELDFATASECRENAGTCTFDPEAGEQGEYVADDVCVGDLLIGGCNGPQALAFDCDAHGGTCDEEAEACVDVPEGTACGADVPFECAAGLVCEGETAQQLGTCVPDDGTGNGTGSGEGTGG